MTYLLSFDPGGEENGFAGTTGWASFGPDGVPKALVKGGLPLGQIKTQKGLYDWLRAVEDPPEVVIIEIFRILGTFDLHFGKEHEVIQNIGIIKCFAFMWGAEIKMQPSNILEQGYAWGNIKKASDHSDSHRRDALAHGYYYFFKKGILTMSKRPEYKEGDNATRKRRPSRK